MRTVFLAWWLFAVASQCVLVGQSLNALALQQRLIDVFQHNEGAVVQVKAAYAQTGVSETGKKEVMLRVGTGFFFSREGHVLVSASRAVGADRVWIEHKGRSYATEALGHDRLTNISILKTLQVPEDFSIINIDTTVGRPDIGSIAVAIACPLDFGPTPSMGLFTGIDKKIGDKFFPTEYIRTSISVDAGQGGCPILDINGRLIGMSVASIPDLDGSYALPVDALARVRDDLIFSGKVIHGWLGFEVKGQLNGESDSEVIISQLVEEAPAALAGLEPGDQLISIAGRMIRDVSDVPSAVFFTRADQFTTVEIVRNGERMSVSVKTLPRPEVEPKIGPSEEVAPEEETEEPQPDEVSGPPEGQSDLADG